jgi:hypothetical protein
MSPWTVRNTFFAWGVDFKRGVTVRTPVSNVDVTPTLLSLMGLDRDPALPRFDGRAITEALRTAPTRRKCRYAPSRTSPRRRTAAIARRSRSPSWARSAISTKAGAFADRGAWLRFICWVAGCEHKPYRTAYVKAHRLRALGWPAGLEPPTRRL